MEARKAKDCRSTRGRLLVSAGWAGVLFLALAPASVLALPVTVAMALLLDFLVVNLLVWTAVLCVGVYRDAAAWWRIARLRSRRIDPRRSQGLTAAHFALS